jgi:hypothetical protein
MWPISFGAGKYEKGTRKKEKIYQKKKETGTTKAKFLS